MVLKAIKIYPEEKRYSTSGCGETYSLVTHEVYLSTIDAEVEEISDGPRIGARISFTRGRTAYDRPVILRVGEETYRNMMTAIPESSKLLAKLDDGDELDWGEYAKTYGVPCIYYGDCMCVVAM